MHLLTLQMVLYATLSLTNWTSTTANYAATDLHCLQSMQFAQSVLSTVHSLQSIQIIRREMSVKIPYLNTGEIAKPDDSFIDLLKNRVCPRFQPVTLSTLLIIACLGIFIAQHIVYSPGGYQEFLQHPKETDDWMLDIQKVKHDRKYFYTVATAMFLHNSYKHIIMNVIFGIFVMYELEYCWGWSILVALVGGFAANCLAIVTMSGRVLGFSGVLCACVGIQIAALILHCNYLRQVYSSQFYIIFMMTVFMLLLIVGFSPSGLIHFYGISFGLLFGLALYPRMPEASVNQNLNKLFKILAVGFLVLVVLLALIA